MRRFGRLSALAAIAVLTVATVASPPGGATSSPTTNPLSLSFISARTGWALGEVACGSDARCFTLSHTTDGARTWSTVALPSGVGHIGSFSYGFGAPGALSVTFANRDDGWIYGWTEVPTATGAVARLWATHDGGRTWTAVNLAAMGVQTQVLALSASSGRAYLIGGRRSERYGIWQTSVGSDQWRRIAGVAMFPPAGGGEITGSLVLHGAIGWALVGNDRGATGAARLDAQGRWTAWADPCTAVGNSYVVPTAFSATSLEDVCTIGGFGSYAKNPPPGAKMESEWIYASHDGGSTFAPVGALNLTHFENYLFTPLGFPAFVTPTTLLLTTDELQGSSGQPVLIESHDQGRSWTIVYRARGQETFPQVTFPTPKVGFAIVQSTPSSFLIKTNDAGATWSRVGL